MHGQPARPRRAAPRRESASITVKAKGRYLKYLPRVFEEQDELMGRFLMLFESFWAPIEGQIDAVHHYFDPALMPLDLLPWLASWVDLTLDDHWPEAKRRQLLKAAVSLYRKRGTRRGLQEYLEIYTGAQVRVSEHGAQQLSPGAERAAGTGRGAGHPEHAAYLYCNRLSAAQPRMGTRRPAGAGALRSRPAPDDRADY